MAEEWVDPLAMQDRRGKPTDALRDMLGGRSVFLACGGPSTKQLPLVELAKKGCWTLAINNMAAHPQIRPQAFVCSDPPSKFHHNIWRDPAIMKLLPKPKLMGGRGRSGMRVKTGTHMEGDELVHDFEPMRIGKARLKTRDMPNAWGFDRRSWLAVDDTFFTETSAAWGNHDAGVARTGEAKTVCTMLLGMRLLRYMGAGRVFLIGVDFFMSPTKGYSFPQGRNDGASVSNNRQFRIVNDWLERFEEMGIFRKYGIEFYNCNPHSGLRAFPHVDFHDAVADATDGIDQKPDLSGWYEKGPKKSKT